MLHGEPHDRFFNSFLLLQRYAHGAYLLGVIGKEADFPLQGSSIVMRDGHAMQPFGKYGPLDPIRAKYRQVEGGCHIRERTLAQLHVRHEHQVAATHQCGYLYRWHVAVQYRGSDPLFDPLKHGFIHPPQHFLTGNHEVQMTGPLGGTPPGLPRGARTGRRKQTID